MADTYMYIHTYINIITYITHTCTVRAYVLAGARKCSLSRSLVIIRQRPVTISSHTRIGSSFGWGYRPAHFCRSPVTWLSRSLVQVMSCRYSFISASICSPCKREVRLLTSSWSMFDQSYEWVCVWEEGDIWKHCNVQSKKQNFIAEPIMWSHCVCYSVSCWLYVFSNTVRCWLYMLCYTYTSTTDKFLKATQLHSLIQIHFYNTLQIIAAAMRECVHEGKPADRVQCSISPHHGCPGEWSRGPIPLNALIPAAPSS